MKKAGKKVKKPAGQKQQPRGGKTSKQPVRVNSRSAAREDTASSDSRSADSSATILTSSNLGELENAICNTPRTTPSAVAIEPGVKAVQTKELLCARCRRKVHGNRRRRNRSPSVDIRHGHQENSASNWKALFYPAAVIIVAIAVVSGIYMIFGTGDADNSDQRDDVQHKQEVFPEILCPCNTSYPTATTGLASTVQPAESDALSRRRRRFTVSTVRGGRRRNLEDTGVLGVADNGPKGRKTKRRGREDPSHKGSSASKKNLPGTTTQVHVGHRIVPARRRPSIATALTTALPRTASSQLRTPTKPNTLTALGGSGKTTSRSGIQRLKPALESSPLPRGTEDKKDSAEEDPFPETKNGHDADAEGEVEKLISGKNNAERRRPAVRHDVGATVDEVGAQSAASAFMHTRKRVVANNLAARPGL